MARIKVPEGETPEFFHAMQMDDELGPPSLALTSAVYGSDRLPIRVREVVRYRIALINNCFACRGTRWLEREGITNDLYDHVREWRTWPGYSAQERIAIEYAEKFVEDHLTIDDEFVARLLDHFTQDEVLVLTLSIGYFLAYGRTTRVLELYGACSLDGSPITP